MTHPTLLALALTLPAAPADRDVRPQPVGRFAHPAIREASGLVASRRHPGVFWVHNDSGNPPLLFAVRRDGSLLREYSVAVPNVDWEDIATDGAGHLYIGDTGNNDGRLPLRAVYQLDEPDPTVPFIGPPDRRSVLTVRTASYYRFGNGPRFDSESLVVRDGKAWLVAKTHDGRDAEVYTIPLDPPAPLTRPAVPVRVGSLPGFKKPATGADLDARGRLAVCGMDAVGVFEFDGDGRFRRVALTGFRVNDQVEAVTWDGPDLLIAGEGRGVYRLDEAAWHGGEKARGDRHGR